MQLQLQCLIGCERTRCEKYAQTTHVTNSFEKVITPPLFHFIWNEKRVKQPILLCSHLLTVYTSWLITFYSLMERKPQILCFKSLHLPYQRTHKLHAQLYLSVQNRVFQRSEEKRANTEIDSKMLFMLREHQIGNESLTVQIGKISSASGARQSCSGSVAFCQSREPPGTETEQYWWPFTALDQLLERRQALVCALLREREETRVHGNCHISIRLGMCIFAGGNVIFSGFFFIMFFQWYFFFP